MKKKRYIYNAWKHFCLINKHRFEVFKLSVLAGIPIRGLLHDLSKYGITEFRQSIKYYTGYRSPITGEKIDKGYSLAYIHHTNHNKHHPEYWFDIHFERKAPMMPYKYAAEMICDKIAAGIVYSGDKFELGEPLEFFNKCRDRDYLNENMIGFVEEILQKLKDKGIKKTINSKNLRIIYNKYLEKERKIEEERKIQNENI